MAEVINLSQKQFDNLIKPMIPRYFIEDYHSVARVFEIQEAFTKTSNIEGDRDFHIIFLIAIQQN